MTEHEWEESSLEDVDKAYEGFRVRLLKYLDYVKYIGTIPEDKRTFKMKEIWAKHGTRVNERVSGNKRGIVGDCSLVGV